MCWSMCLVEGYLCVLYVPSLLHVGLSSAVGLGDSSVSLSVCLWSAVAFHCLVRSFIWWRFFLFRLSTHFSSYCPSNLGKNTKSFFPPLSLSLKPQTANECHFFFICVSFHPPPVQLEVKTELYTLFPGERLALMCLGPVEAPQEVRWTKQGVPVTAGGHVLIRDGRLEIEAADLTDSGLYGCSNHGPPGNHSAFFSVNVTGTCYT